MSPESWTFRYGGSRTAPGPVLLKPPLERIWRYKPKGVGLGFVRAGDGAAWTNVGKWGVTRLDLESGKPAWIDQSKKETSCFVRWRDLIIADADDAVKALAVSDGQVEWEKTVEGGFGTQDSYISNDLFVGYTADHFHVRELPSLRVRWRLRGLPRYPLVGDDRVVIRADKSIWCHDLRTGAIKWHRSVADVGDEVLGPGCIWEERFFVDIGGQLTALDVGTGKLVWHTDLCAEWWHPYMGRIYSFSRAQGNVYRVTDMKNGKILFKRELGHQVPRPVEKKKTGLRSAVRGQADEAWRNVRIAVSETHAFLQNSSGQIVVLARDTGELEQVVEIDGQPIGVAEPLIYENRLLLADFNPYVYCFRGAV